MWWLDVVPLAALLAAGLPRLAAHSPRQRALAGAFVAAALALALESDLVETAVTTGTGSTILVFIQCLAVTAAAAATYGLARRVSLAPLFQPVPPLAAAAPVALCQGVLLYLADTTAAPPTHDFFLAHAHQPQIVGLWCVTTGAAGAAGALLLLVVRQYGPGMAGRGLRFASRCIQLGVLLLIPAALLRGAQVLVATADAADADAAEIHLADPALAPAGLTLIAVGVLAARSVPLLKPLERWFSAHRALRRLSRLAAELIAAAPEWGDATEASAWSLRDPSGQLYLKVILIRNASFSLWGGYTDDALIGQALAFAQDRVASGRYTDMLAVAEACWLRAAINNRARGTEPNTAEVEFGDRGPAGPAGSLRDDTAFLLAVERTWSGPLVEEFLNDLAYERRPARGH